MEIKIADIFLYCNNIEEMRYFYLDIIGLNLAHFSHELSHLSFKIDSETYFVVMQSKEIQPKKQGWAKGPVFDEGTTYDMSWTIQVETMEKFDYLIKRIKENNFETFSEEPKVHETYSTFLVKDPMGNTVELYCNPKT